ncbi:MAG: 5'/3'-nucleotidase SurE [Alphaproteobacteria bacterium]
MRILISNDDGINAHGLKVLENVARTISDDIWIIAPEGECSAAGHSLTINSPLRVREVSEKKYAIKGTPTDCVLIGISNIMKDCPPDLVLSGINHGGNIAEDITYSGTVAVAMEATLMGVQAIAFSLGTAYDRPAKWATAEHHAPALLKQLIALKYAKGVFMNVNFPNVIASSVKGVRVACQGQRIVAGDKLIKRLDPRGVAYYWISGVDYHQSGPQGTDLNAVAEGFISITPLSLDFTHQQSLESLQKIFPQGDYE